MSSAFTDTGTKDLQSLTLFNELQTAYSERRQILGQSSQSNWADDDYIQKWSMWYNWQDWIETYCTSFLNYDGSGPLIDTESSTGYTPFTLASFRTKAGLNASGFKRRYRVDRETVGTAYGKATVDDYVQQHLIDELQNAFSVLRYTVQSATGSGTVKVASDYGTYLDGDSWAISWGLATAAADTAYAAATPSSSTSIELGIFGLPSSWAPTGASAPYPVQSFATKSSTAWQISNNLGTKGAFLDEAYLLLKGKKLPEDTLVEYLSSVYDDGSHNVTEGWDLNETVSAGASPTYTIASTARTHEEIDWPTDAPYLSFIADPAPPPYIDDKEYDVSRGYYVATADRYWILKWDFTNI